eukprot:TRINITY_DN407_c0_g1_i7.p1 TRINITY_DN407_c0_g1~~TRINITY_DN407_c0_g1_i7.p1  ORF type:complete len:308 (-),score=102.29 TRINITY_DN407_c0_g1_i7:167-1090(-)
MAPSVARTVGLAVLSLVLGFACTSAFVAAPGSGQGHLRSPRLQQLSSQPAFGASAGKSGGLLTACSMGGLLVAAAAAVARRAAKPKEEVKPEFIPRPEDLLESPKFPMFAGNSGGYMSKATRERHAITWTAKENRAFELPTGGLAFMNKGENLCYFRKKEQCIMVGKQLREMKIENYKVYRLKKDGTVVFMHPADGVFPEKVNKGRVQVNGRPFSIGQNPVQSELRFTKYHKKAYEADPLTTMFVKARIAAFEDVENLFALPQPNMDETLIPEEEREKYTEQEYTTKMMEALKRVQDDRKAKAAQSL